MITFNLWATLFGALLSTSFLLVWFLTHSVKATAATTFTLLTTYSLGLASAFNYFAEAAK